MDRLHESLARERATAEAAAEKIAALRAELANQSEFYQKELDMHERAKRQLEDELIESGARVSELESQWDHSARDKASLQQEVKLSTEEKKMETSAGAERVKLLEGELQRQESFSREQISLLNGEISALREEKAKELALAGEDRLEVLDVREL